MGGYQLNDLQSGFHNPSARLGGAKPAKNGRIERDDGSGVLGKKSKRSESSKDIFGFGLFPSKRVSSQQSLEGLMQQEGFSPPRHSTACCDGLSLGRELSTERRLSTKVRMSLHDTSSDSFRSDDSDHLALWEEKEHPTGSSDRDGWMKLTATHSPRWLDAMARLAPWRSSPVHPKSSDTPRVSLDRKPSTRSLHESTKAWYSKKKWGPKVVRQSGEPHAALVINSAKWDDTSEDGSSFSRMMEEDTRFTASAVAWDISPRTELTVVENPRQIPAEIGNGIEDHAKTMGSHDVVTGIANGGEDIMVKECGDSPRSEAVFDGLSEYASCRTFVEDESLSDNDSQPEIKSEGFVSTVDFVAPLFAKKEDSSSKGGEKRVSFKWEAGPKMRAEEVAPTTETPQPPPIGSTPYETLRQQYMMKSKSAPLDGLYVFLPQGDSAKLPLPLVNEASENAALKKSRSCTAEHRRAKSSSDLRLFAKLRKSLLGYIKNEEYMESTSPRSILRGPDDGMSVPSSSNPSLRSEPGTARPTSASQSMSSCSASFDLNEGDYEMTYNQNSSATCIIVESRRVSLSFRDFGTAQSADMAEPFEAATSNVELVQLDANALHSSPKLWNATFSARFRESDTPAESPRARESEVTELPSPPPMRQLAYLMSVEDEQNQQRPITMQKSRSRNSGEFTARLGVMFSPLRLMSSHESSNHGYFATTTVSLPHDEGEEARPPAFGSTEKILPPVELRSSSTKSRKAKDSWTNAELGTSRSSKRRHSSEDPQTMMVTLSKAMRKILSKCSVKRSTRRRKPKMDAPPLAALSPPEFHFS